VAPIKCRPSRAQQLGIAFHRARIGVKIFIRSKLGGVYEDRHNHRIGMSPRLCDQRHMPVMQRAHRRDQRDAPLGVTQRQNMLPQCVKLIDGLHVHAALFIGLC